MTTTPLLLPFLARSASRSLAAVLAAALVAGCGASDEDPQAAAATDPLPGQPRATPAAADTLEPDRAGSAGESAGADEVRPAPDWIPWPDIREARFLDFVAPKPVTWLEQRPVGIRVASWIVPGRDGGNQAHVAVFSFPDGEGGSREANIDRWRTQFRPDEAGSFPPVSTRDFASDGLPVTLVEIRGARVREGNRWYTEDQALIAAVIEDSRGPVFVRLTGDAATVDGHREAFERMIRELRRVPEMR